MRHEIWLFSGLGSSILPSLSYGTRTLEAMIDKLPYAESNHRVWNQWPSVARLIADRWAKTRDPFKTVLVGHSNGVIATNSIAEYLDKRGLPVDYIGAIDPTAAAFPLIGNNVVETAEFWATSGWPHLTRRMSGGRRAALHYVDGWTGVKRLYPAIRGSHVACASNPRVHETIVNDLKRILA